MVSKAERTTWVSFTQESGHVVLVGERDAVQRGVTQTADSSPPAPARARGPRSSDLQRLASALARVRHAQMPQDGMMMMMVV